MTTIAPVLAAPTQCLPTPGYSVEPTRQTPACAAATMNPPAIDSGELILCAEAWPDASIKERYFDGNLLLSGELKKLPPSLAAELAAHSIAAALC